MSVQQIKHSVKSINPQTIELVMISVLLVLSLVVLA